MKKQLLLTLICCSFAFGLGFGINNVAFSDGVPLKVAYVNIPQILNASKALKAAQDTKIKQEKDMLNWFKTANADIDKQKTQSGKEALVKKYESQLDQKKKTIKNSYVKKVNEIDAQMNNAITQKSKAMGYDLVLKKDSVLFGGTDITKDIIPLIK